MALPLRSVFALLAMMSLVACAHHGKRHAIASTSSGPPPGVSVTGLGEAWGAPNVARATVGVEVRAETAERALSEANTRSAAILSALRQQGVAEQDIRTNNVALDFERIYEPPPQPLAQPAAPAPRAAPAAPGKVPEVAPALPQPALPRGFYRASNSVEVTVRRLDRVGQVLGAAAGAGADQLSGVEFRIEDPSPLESTARQKAMANARARAELLAQLAGLRLGRAVSISEDAQSSPHRPMMMMRAEAANAQSVPVSSGQLKIGIAVQVVYELLNADGSQASP
jgi:hypothetical protein